MDKKREIYEGPYPEWITQNAAPFCLLQLTSSLNGDDLYSEINTSITYSEKEQRGFAGRGCFDSNVASSYEVKIKRNSGLIESTGTYMGAPYTIYIRIIAHNPIKNITILSVKGRSEGDRMPDGGTIVIQEGEKKIFDIDLAEIGVDKSFFQKKQVKIIKKIMEINVSVDYLKKEKLYFISDDNDIKRINEFQNRWVRAIIKNCFSEENKEVVCRIP